MPISSFVSEYKVTKACLQLTLEEYKVTKARLQLTLDEYKVTKARLLLTLRHSEDEKTSDRGIQARTWVKQWNKPKRITSTITV